MIVANERGLKPLVYHNDENKLVIGDRIINGPLTERDLFVCSCNGTGKSFELKKIVKN